MNEAEIAGIVRDISQLISEGTPAQEIAVLARTNNQLNGLESANSARPSIPSSKHGTFFERKEVRDFLKQVRTASVIPTEGVSWLDELRTLAQPFLSGGAIDGIAAAAAPGT
jgi:DNA helicase-2/ATP-dependent DNA helicase PcrA